MHDIDSVKKRIITSMIAILLLIFALFGITYAYFTAKVKGNTNDKSVDVSAGKLELTYCDGNGFIKVDKIQPGEVIKSKTFTVKNTGTGDIDSYEVILENVINELKYYNDLTYELECISNVGTCKGTNNTFPIYDNPIVVNSIKVGETHTYTLTLSYHETNLDQSDDMDKTIEAKVNIRDSEFNYTKLNIYGNSEGLGTLVNDETSRFNEKYKIEIKSIGKNLFDINKITTFVGYDYNIKRPTYSSISDNIITSKIGAYGNMALLYDSKIILPVGIYTISADFMADKDSGNKGVTIGVRDLTNEITKNVHKKLSNYRSWERINYTFSLETQSEVAVQVQGTGEKDDYTNLNIKIKNIQLEKSEKSTVYEPYEEIVYSIYVDEPLRCINSTCDYMDLVNKKVIRKIKNDNGTLSVLDTPSEEKIQALDTDILTSRTIAVENATNVEQELDR